MQYVVALLIVGAAAVLTRLVADAITVPSMIPLFLVAVALSAWLGGVGPGLTAGVASIAAIASLVFVVGDIRHLGGTDVLRVLSLLPVALFIGLLYSGKTRAEQALRERDARLQLVSEQIPGGLWSTDNQLRLTSGFGAQSAILHGPLGTTLYQHFNTEDPGFAPIAAHRRALRGESSSYELQWCGRTFQSYVEPLRDIEGQIIGVVGIATDITDRKYAEEERERLVRALETQHARLNAIVESIPAGIVVAEAPEGRVVMQNSKVEEVLRQPLVPPDGQPGAGPEWHAYDADGARVGADQMPLARALRGEVVRDAEYVYARGDGSRGWVRAAGAPVRDSHGQIVGSVAIVYDIDQVKQSEEQLRQAKQQLEAANHAKDRFLAMLSHELRTPLTPVLALASSLAERTDLPAGLREDLEMIRRNTALEATLIDDLLDVTRISRGKLQLNVHDLNLNDLLRNAVEVCRPDTDAKQITVDLELGATRAFVQGDAARLQQVFWNLIKNAVKFTPAGGRVAVRSSDLGEDEIRVDVIDTGIGIDAEVLPRIFDAFEQGASSITRQFGGLGLGLAISKALVEAHHGRISVTSDGPGTGACFSVELRTVEPEAVHSAQPTDGAGTAVGSLRILLVEDHADSAKVMQRLLRKAGHVVETAPSVNAGLRAFESAALPFDLLISDLGLPDGSGLDLMRELARRPSRVRAIALSGFGTEDDVQRSLAAGFAAHLTKPVPMATLRRVIAQVARGPMPEGASTTPEAVAAPVE
jgi:two-component system CheB/CheR fusion protein